MWLDLEPVRLLDVAGETFEDLVRYVGDRSARAANKMSVPMKTEMVEVGPIARVHVFEYLEFGEALNDSIDS